MTVHEDEAIFAEVSERFVELFHAMERAKERGLYVHIEVDGNLIVPTTFLTSGHFKNNKTRLVASRSYRYPPENAS